MAHDVFLSYSRNDRAIAELVAAAIESSGLTVWWDRDLLPTAEVTFEAMIERHMSEASSVLVLWSRVALASPWVMAEAELGRWYEKLVQARLDSTSLPLPFGSYHCASLEGWHGEKEAPEFVSILAGLKRNSQPRRQLTQTHNYYRPPEDVPTYGYKLDPPYRFQAIRASLRPREVLMCFLKNPTEEGWNSACHVGAAERLEDFERDHGGRVELYAVERDKLRGEFDEDI